jgi:hypothetical protein
MIVRPARPAQASIALCLLALVLAALGCTEKLVEPPPPAVETTTGVPDSIQAVFTANCAFDGCHGGTSPQRGMDLTGQVASYEHIVGIAANEVAAFKRIAPGDSANSYMVMKLRNTAGIAGQPMPFGAYPLDPALVIKIAAWAQQGAPGVPVVAARRTVAWTAHR